MSKDAAAQATQASEDLNQGAQLLMAFRSEPGQIILGELVAIVREQLEALLFEPLDDAEALAKLNACRAFIQLHDVAGDKIRLTLTTIARKTIQQKLGVKTKPKEVPHEENE